MQKVLSHYIHPNADAENAENSDDAVQALLARQRRRIRATENARHRFRVRAHIKWGSMHALTDARWFRQIQEQQYY